MSPGSKAMNEPIESVAQGTARVLYERYRIEDRIAAGSAGLVYAAVDIKTGEDVVVKVFPDASVADDKGAWAKEMRLAFRLVHPNIARCLNAGFSGADEDSILVFERISGGSLRRHLVQRQKLSDEEVTGLLCDVGAALQFAHRKGVIHRDVKPENVLYEDGRWLLTDFGSGRFLSSTAQAATLIGSLGYIGPETFLNRTVFASDQYGLGVTAWECMGRSRPRNEVRSQAWLNGHRRTDLEGVVATMLAGHPERRWPHMSAALAMLETPGIRDFAVHGSELWLLGERTVTAHGAEHERVVWRGSQSQHFGHVPGEAPILICRRRIVDLATRTPETFYARDESFELVACSRVYARALLRIGDELQLVTFGSDVEPRRWPLRNEGAHRTARGLFVGPDAVLLATPGARRGLHLDLSNNMLREREVVFPLPFVEWCMLGEPVLICGDSGRTELIRPQLGPERQQKANAAPDHVRVVRQGDGPALEVIPALSQPESDGEHT